MSKSELWRIYKNLVEPDDRTLKYRHSTLTTLSGAIEAVRDAIAEEKKVPNIAWTAKFTLNGNRLTKSGVVRLKGKDRTDKKKINKQILDELRKDINRYVGDVSNIKTTFKIELIEEMKGDDAKKLVREQKLNAVVYSLPNSKADSKQLTEKCVVNYVIKRANMRRGRKDITEDTIKYILDRDELDTGITSSEIEKLAESLKMNATGVMLNYGDMCFSRCVYMDGTPKKPEGSLNFYIANGHCYPIDRNQIHSFNNCVRGNMWSNKKKDEKTVINECNLAWQTQFRLMLSGDTKEKTKTVFDMEDFPMDDVLEIMEETKTHFTIMSKRNSIKSLCIKNRSIVACKDYKISKIVAKKFNMKFDCQSLSTLSIEYFRNKYKLPNSYLNTRVNEIYEYVSTAPCAFKHSDLDGTEKAYDIIKCYTSCLIDEQDYPIFTISDDIEENDDSFDLDMRGWELPDFVEGEDDDASNPFFVDKAGIYYVETKNIFPLQGSGWYSTPTISFCIDNDIISEKDLKYRVIAQHSINSSRFKKFVEHVYLSFDTGVAKKLINYFIGSLNFKRNTVETTRLTNSKHEAVYWFNTQNDTTYQTYDIDSTQKSIHCITSRGKEYKDYSTTKPIYTQIIESGRIKAYQLWKALEPHSTLVGVKTDCIIVRPHKNYVCPLELSADKKAFGCYRIDEPSLLNCVDMDRYTAMHEFNGKVFHHLHKGMVRTVKSPWKTATNDIKEYGSLCLDGGAGVGKTFLMKAYCEDNGIQALAFTNTACNNFKDGKTLNSFFKIGVEDDKVAKFNTDEKYVVDEYSMVSSDIYASLYYMKLNNPSMKFVFSGDQRQIQAIPRTDLLLNKPIPRLLETTAFKELCDFNKKELTKCRRADDKFYNICISNFDNDGEYEEGQVGFDDTKETTLHLVATNIKRANLNISTNNTISYREGKKPTDIILTDMLRFTPVYWYVNGEKVLQQKMCNLKIYDGTPWISSKTVKKSHLYKNCFTKLTVGKDKKKNEKRYIQEDEETGKKYIYDTLEDMLKHFDLRYSITCNKAQGKTFREQYKIHEWKKFDKYKKYTACSRATRVGQFKVV